MPGFFSTETPGPATEVVTSPEKKTPDPRLASSPPGTVGFIGEMPVDENGMDTSAAVTIRAKREKEKAAADARKAAMDAAT